MNISSSLSSISSPSSSSSSESTDSSQLTFLSCQICEKPAHGNHFGAITCRACAAFFRRAILGKYSNTKCKFGSTTSCISTENNRIDCKKCRLEKCQRNGMTSKNFQFGRDLISTTKKTKSSLMPKSVESFVGRPHFILFFEPKNNVFTKTMIDVNHLVTKANDMFLQGPTISVLNSELNCLSRMTFGMSKTKSPSLKPQMQTDFGKEMALSVWENDFLQVADWLTYCDEFQKLPKQAKIQCLQFMWLLWVRLYRITITAEMRRKKSIDDKSMMLSNDMAFCMDDINLDVSWFTNYSRQQMAYFIDIVDRIVLDEVIDPLMELQPTDTELTFMLFQICFNTIGKKFQGDILTVTEKLEERITNDLHDYYVNELKMNRYSARLAKIMKINKSFEKDFRFRQDNFELARMFDVFTIEFTHPEMFYTF